MFGLIGLLVRNLPPGKCVLMSTSGAVRSDMRGWIVTDEGDRWSVRLDVRDLGGHLDTTFRGWSATLAKRVRLVIARLVLIFVLPLEFHGRLRVTETLLFLVLCMGLRLPSLQIRAFVSSAPLCAELFSPVGQRLARAGAALGWSDWL